MPKIANPTQRDLYESIERRDYPRWKFPQIQLMTGKGGGKLSSQSFDLTKVWPHKDFPLQDVGILELNRNPENYFAEVEQSAFNPQNIVEGIGFSPDKMLQGGDYSLMVMHNVIVLASMQNKYRSIDRVVPFHAFHRDGAMRVDGNYGSAKGYEP